MSELNIHQRMLAVMRDVERVQKEDRQAAGKFYYVSHDAVTKALHGPCVKHGILITTSVTESDQDGNRTSAHIEVRFINTDNPKDFFTVQAFGYGIDKQDKGPGMAVSYALKTCLLKQFLLEAGEGDNEGRDEDHKPDPQAARGGPRKMASKYDDGVCGICGEPIGKGDQIAYKKANGDRKSQVAHWACYENHLASKEAAEPENENQSPPVEDDDLPF